MTTIKVKAYLINNCLLWFSVPWGLTIVLPCYLLPPDYYTPPDPSKNYLMISAYTSGKLTRPKKLLTPGIINAIFIKILENQNYDNTFSRFINALEFRGLIDRLNEERTLLLGGGGRIIL